MPSNLYDRVQRFLPLVEKVSFQNVSEEILGLTPRMFGVIHKVAKLLCDYVKRSRWSSPRFDKLLMIAARTTGGATYPEMIREMERELTEVIEDFDRAVNVEALRLANETSKLSFSSCRQLTLRVCCRASRPRASRPRTSGPRTSGARTSGPRTSRPRTSGARVLV